MWYLAFVQSYLHNKNSALVIFMLSTVNVVSNSEKVLFYCVRAFVCLSMLIQNLFTPSKWRFNLDPQPLGTRYSTLKKKKKNKWFLSFKKNPYCSLLIFFVFAMIFRSQSFGSEPLERDESLSLQRLRPKWLTLPAFSTVTTAGSWFRSSSDWLPDQPIVAVQYVSSNVWLTTDVVWWLSVCLVLGGRDD